MQVQSNSPAFTVWKTYTSNVTNMRNSMAKLSSGIGILSAGDDPAGLAISERMRAQYRNSEAAGHNIQNAISYFQTADSWLQKIHDILGRMAELAISANDGTKSAVDRNNLNLEFLQMQAEIRRITDGSAAAAQYNGEAIFHGARNILQIGPDCLQQLETVSIDLRSDENTTNLGKASMIEGDETRWTSVVGAQHGISIGRASMAAVAVGKINLGIDHISNQRAVIGAQQSRLVHTLEGLRNYEDNLRAAESRIRDVDVARETTEFSKYQILTQIGTAMLAQANALPGTVMTLLG